MNSLKMGQLAVCTNTQNAKENGDRYMNILNALHLLALIQRFTKHLSANLVYPTVPV